MSFSRLRTLLQPSVLVALAPYALIFLAAMAYLVVIMLRRPAPAPVPTGVPVTTRQTVAAVLPPTPSKPLRVVLRSLTGRDVNLNVSGRASAVDPSSGRLFRSLPGTSMYISADAAAQRVLISGSGFTVWEPEVRIVSRGGFISLGGRRYRGSVIARLYKGGLLLVNEIGLEPYLEGVLPGELPKTFAMEAQKALAVAARTYALRNRDKHAAEHADVCDGVHCQMYLGHSRLSPRGTAAVRATRGLCAWHGGELVVTFYSADCGGQTTAAALVPLTDMPEEPPVYLKPVLDRPSPRGPDYCRSSPHHWWTRTITAAELEAAFNSQEDTWIGRLRNVSFTGRDSSGRVTRVRLDGEETTAPGAGTANGVPATPKPISRTITGWRFRWVVGVRRIKSTRMWLKVHRDRVQISGGGYGHGLGLCQFGANGMASPPHRRNFRQILHHYYRGITIAPLGKPPA